MRWFQAHPDLALHVGTQREDGLGQEASVLYGPTTNEMFRLADLDRIETAGELVGMGHLVGGSLVVEIQIFVEPWPLFIQECDIFVRPTFFVHHPT